MPRQDEFGAKALRLALGTSDDVVGGKLAVSSEELAARAKSIEYKPLVDKSKTVVRHFGGSKTKPMWVPKSAREDADAVEAVKAAQAAAARLSGSGAGGVGQGGARILRRGASGAGASGATQGLGAARILKKGSGAKVKEEGATGARILKRGGGGGGGGGGSGAAWGLGLKQVKKEPKKEKEENGGDDDSDSDLDVDIEDDSDNSDSEEDEEEIAARRSRLRARLLEQQKASEEAGASAAASTARAAPVTTAVAVVEDVARVVSKGAGSGGAKEAAKDDNDDDNDNDDSDDDDDDDDDEDDDDDDDSDGDSDSDSDESSSDEEEDAPKIRFVPRSQRATVLARERKAEEAEKRIKVATEKRLKRQGRARQDVLNLVEAERAAAEKAAKEAEARSSGNVIAGSKDAEGMPDDIDLDEEAEQDFKAWSERELKRLQRSARQRLRAERDEAEKKRRRQMTEEEKRAEDEALIKAGLKVDAHKKDKTNMQFMQTYRHKGAFFQDKDELAPDDVRLRNVNAVATQSEGSRDMSALPKVMQVKRFGRKGNTKYTHLADQDTSRAGNSLRQKFRGGGGGGGEGEGGGGEGPAAIPSSPWRRGTREGKSGDPETAERGRTREMRRGRRDED